MSGISKKVVLAIMVLMFVWLGYWSINHFDGVNSSKKPGNELFVKDHVATIHIDINESNWQQLVNSKDESLYVRANFRYDKEYYENVAIRPKGFSSLMSAGNNGRLPLKIDFNFFNKEQNFRGIKKMNLNNGFMDPSFIRDILGYELFDKMGLPTPRASLADIWVNDTHIGLYTIVEQIDKTFLRRNFKNPDGNLYKPEPIAGPLNWTKEDVVNELVKIQAAENNKNQNLDVKIGGTTLRNLLQALKKEGYDVSDLVSEEDIAASQTNSMFGGFGMGGFGMGGFPGTANAPDMTGQPGPFFAGFGMGGFGMGGFPGTANAPDATGQAGQFPAGFGMGGFGAIGMGFDFGATGGILEQMVIKTNENSMDYAGLFNFLEVLNKSHDETFPSEIEKVLDVDSFLRFLAVSSMIVHLDNYNGSVAHNYYLYEDNGKFTVIPWDLNLAFGTLVTGYNGNVADFPIDEPVPPGVLGERPLVTRILAHQPYLDKYHQYLREMLDGVFAEGVIEKRIDELAKLIRSHVEKDTLKFYSNNDFEIGIEGASTTTNTTAMAGMGGFNIGGFGMNNALMGGFNMGGAAMGGFGMGTNMPPLKTFIKERRQSVIDQLEGKKASCYENTQNIQNNGMFNMWGGGMGWGF